MAGKRDVQVGTRISAGDLKLLQKAAKILWPGLELTSSTLLVSLARLKAEEVLKGEK